MPGLFGNAQPRDGQYKAAGIPDASTPAQLLNLVGMMTLGTDILGGQRRAKLAGVQDDFLSQLAQATQGSPGSPGLPMQGPGMDGSPVGGMIGASAPRAPLTINDPRMAALQIQADRLGVPISRVIDIMKAQQPHIAFAPDNTAINDKDGSIAGKVFPKLGEGMLPQRDASGALTGVVNAPNYVRSLAEAEAAKTGAQEGAKAAFVYGNARNQSRGNAEGSAPYDFISVPGPDGRPMVVSKSQAVGGAFAGQAPADAAYGNNLATASAEQYKGIQTAGTTAASKIARYKQIDSLLGKFEGGKLSPMGLDIASAANSMGFKIDKNLPNAQAADALGKQLVLDSNGGSLGTGFSNADREFLQSTVPGILQSAGGRQKLIQIGVATEQRKQDIAAKARQWNQRFGRIDKPDATGKTFQDYLDVWAEANPVFTGK